MIAWSSWTNDLAVHVIGCPSVVIEAEVRKAAQEFFRQSKCWRIEENARAVSAGVQSVDATPTSSDLDLVNVDAVRFDGNLLAPTSIELLDQLYSGDWADDTATAPTCYFQLTPNIVRVYPIPDADAVTGIALRLVVAPSDASAGLDDGIAAMYRKEIRTGALASLLMYQKTDWTNFDLGLAYMKLFDSMIASANSASAKAFVRARIPSRVTWC